MSVSYGGDSITFADGSVNSSGFIGHRNRIINGAMVIDQRSAGASVTTSAGNNYTPDRWLVYDTAGSKLAVQQVTDGPTGSGFVKSQKITSQAATTPGSTDYYFNCQRIEGFNVADLGWGTASAVSVTLSFWVKSSLTGSFSGAFGNTSFTRSYPFSYTINSANTWEYKTVTVGGDTTGTWATDNTAGLQVVFDLGSGSSRAGTVNTWSGNDYRKVTSSVNLIGTSGATWFVTGVQLERGSTASSFEYRPYGTELFLCQRYYERLEAQSQFWVPNGGYLNYLVLLWQFRVPKRTAPTLSTISGVTATLDSYGQGGVGISSSAADSATQYSARLNFILTGNQSLGTNITLTNTFFQASAEL